MFAKLFVIILGAGAIACALLVNRQQRIDTAHELSRTHHRLIGYEQTMWKLRSEIAERCRPEHLRQLVDEHGGAWAPIPATPVRQANLPAVATRVPTPETRRDRSG